MNASFDSLVQQYFEVMNKNNTKTTELKKNDLTRIKTELLNIYSPAYDETHALFLGLLNDVICILEHNNSPGTRVAEQVKQNDARVAEPVKQYSTRAAEQVK